MCISGKKRVWANLMFDPYFDLHLEKAVNQMETGGRYITCGYKNQHPDFSNMKMKRP